MTKRKAAFTFVLFLVSGLAVLSSGSLAAPTSSAKTGVACPKTALALEVNSIAPAATAALADESAASKPQVVSASLATLDADRGSMAKRQCGAKAWQRTVVVYINLRAYKSASLSSRVDFVARFADGYKVWEVVH